ncbi:MAG: glycosyltransferase family 2 protein [Oscillospiraceae bacterium]
MEFIKYFNYLISLIFVACYSYQLFFVLVPFFKKAKPHKDERLHRYAVLICARNEQAVIANLIESIKSQHYPEKLITIFVVADGCTDNTALIAQRAGAKVYTRNNPSLVGKGYALNFLLNNIKEDYPADSFEGYFVFDADNVLSENFVLEMNRTFSDGYEIVTGYRNSKNYGENWVSAGYALWFLRESKFLNNSRFLMNTSCAVSGTGFMFSDRILKEMGGWDFFLLTEDIEFSIYNVLHKNKIGYCEKAEFFDEQPTTFAQSWRQRLRWAKGYLQVFQKDGRQLVKNIFTNFDFACYDMTMSIMPAVVLTVLSIVVNAIFSTVGIFSGQDVGILGLSILESIYNAYMLLFYLGAITTLSQWKQIHTPWYKKILYTFSFPIFMLSYIPISVSAMFCNVTWQPIVHSDTKNLARIRQD